jgi:hypothetical protein
MTTAVSKKKKCPICGKDKAISSGFYKSTSPLYSEDGCVPICISCVKKEVLNDDGTINQNKFRRMLMRLDKPLYWDTLESSYAQFKREHSFLPDDEVAKNGKDIVGFYFKNIMLRQNRDKNYADSEKDGFMHQTSNTTLESKKEIAKKYSKEIEQEEEENKASRRSRVSAAKSARPIVFESDDFEVTQDMIDLFGEGYTRQEYKKMWKKYQQLKQTYVIQTSIHQEALVTYVRFKVKEEIATSKGEVAEAQKWYNAAQDAAEKGKLTARQISKEDLQGGIVNFSDIFSAVEGAKERIKIFPEFKYQPKDAADFIIWCYVNYERNLHGLPEAEYKDIYEFYDEKKKEYLEAYGDPYGIFKEDTTESNRDTIEKFITVPLEFRDGDK